MASLAAGNPMVVGVMNDRLKALTTSFAQQMGREFVTNMAPLMLFRVILVIK